jgi:hypothetical protein
LQHDEWQTARTACDPKLSGQRRCLAAGIAFEELRV